MGQREVSSIFARLHQVGHSHLREPAGRLGRLAFVLTSVIVQSCSIHSAYVNERLASARTVGDAGSDVAETIFLIGDAGDQEETGREPVLVALEHQASERPGRSTIVFLGDNVYPEGMPSRQSEDRAEAERRLEEQLRIADNSGAKSIFIPGNHDWGTENDSGRTYRREAEFLASRRNPKLMASPSTGLPGPEVVDIGEIVRLITLDTEWWLHGSPKPLYQGSGDELSTRKLFLDSLSNLMASAGKRSVIVLGHHPLDSHGTHSGFFDWRDHLFPLRNLVPWLWLPLPGVGSLYPFLRNHGVSSEDFSGGKYREMRAALSALFGKSTPLVYASGHEHVLEILGEAGGRVNIVSGFGTSEHDPSLTTADNTIFADRNPGFMRLDFLSGGGVRLAAIEPADAGGTPQEIFSMWLKRGP